MEEHEEQPDWQEAVAKVRADEKSYEVQAWLVAILALVMAISSCFY